MTAPKTLKPCGTLAAYQRHLRRGEAPCADCRRANRDYHRRDRATNPKRQEREAIYNAAYDRAATRLTHAFPDAFRALLNEELGK